MTSPVFMPPGSDTADLLPLTKTGKLSAKKLKNLTREEAKALTREIQGRTTPHLWLLVERAHDGRACDVLGFNNWKDYTERELEISESRSFQLLDQAKVMRELAAAGHNVMELEPVPARVVAKVKNSLPQVRETARTALEDGQDVHQAIRALAQTLYAAREPQAVREPRRPATRTPAAGEAICPCCNGQGVVPALTAKLIVQFLEAST